MSTSDYGEHAQLTGGDLPEPEDAPAVDDHDDLPRIYIWCEPAETWGPGHVVGYAMSEDGSALASHVSSNESFSKHDMGVTSDWKHQIYEKKYPDGYEIVWLSADEREHDEGFQKALKR